MTTGQDPEMGRLLRESGFGTSLVEVRTERDTGEVTWAKFQGHDDYFTVEAAWSVESTVESISAQLAAEARRRLIA